MGISGLVLSKFRKKLWKETEKESKLEKREINYLLVSKLLMKKKLKANSFLSICILFLLYDLCLFHIRSVKWAIGTHMLCNRRKRFLLVMTSGTSSDAFKMFLLSDAGNNKSTNNVIVTQYNNLVILPETSMLWLAQLHCSLHVWVQIQPSFATGAFIFTTCFMCIPDQGQLGIINVTHSHENTLKNGLASV